MAEENTKTNVSNKNANRKLTKKKNFYLLDKFIAGLSLVGFLVIMIAGFKQGVSVTTISFRAMIVIIFLAFVKVGLVKILMNYEEMSGE